MNHIKEHPWEIIEEGFHPEFNRFYESLMSLGNGHMGHRGNFEEDYSGDSLLGSYIAGVYYPDKTKVGWWKNGYPEYFAKVLNSTNVIGIHIEIDGETVDLGKNPPVVFKRILDMKSGILIRTFTYKQNGKSFDFHIKRFLSYDTIELGAIEYSITAVNLPATITFKPYLDGNIRNEDANYDEYFWKNCSVNSDKPSPTLTMTTKKTEFVVSSSMCSELVVNGQDIKTPDLTHSTDKYVEHSFNTYLDVGHTATLCKYFSIATNRDHEVNALETIVADHVLDACQEGFYALLKKHADKWLDIWKYADIEIEGDIAAQQGIRFNIFHLKQTYNGADSRLNIGPKGFTGEKYGGSTYWDTEAYCLPFYLSTSTLDIARNLLIYRYQHLEKAIENATKLGVKGALYPMVTMNGEECHNEWEITFEEIHRNSAIAYAIFNYIRYTGDKSYLVDYGFEVLLNISRYWGDRCNYNEYKDCYMILGVTGPNEYENNVNNNWHTNRMAVWTLEYTLDAAEYVQHESVEKYAALISKYKITHSEINHWKNIIDKMYLPEIESLSIFGQQDGYMDKEQEMVSDLDPSHLPLNQNWSWDKILRSCFIKQADVLQGLFFLSDQYDLATKKRNFDFYEPRTVHESSLSPCVHSIIACEIGYHKKAYELYQRSARLDLDNYNNDTEDGLHITSMAGSWMSVIYGFGGLSVSNDQLKLRPSLPLNWSKLSFQILFRKRLIVVSVIKDTVSVKLVSGEPLKIKIYDKLYTLQPEVCINTTAQF